MKTRTMLLVILITMLALSANLLFANGEAEESDEIVLTYVYWGSPAEDAAVKSALKGFEAANPGITVEPMYLPGDLDGSTYNAKMKSMAVSKTLPDVGYFRPEEFGTYVKNDYFLQLDDLIERDNMDEDYLAQTWLKVGGKTYGAYTAAECQVMWYNKEVLREAGVPAPPTDYREGWSWDEFVGYLKQITVDTNGRHPGESGFDASNVERYGVTYDLWAGMYYPIIWSNGGEILSRDGRSVLIDKPAAMEAFQNVADLMHVHNVMPYTGGGTNVSPSVMLANGQLGFWVTGQWTLLEMGAIEGLDLGVAALPVMDEPAQIYLSGVNVVFKSSEHPEEAWALQKWMMNPEKTIDLYTSGLWMPTKESYYTDPADMAKWLDNDVHPEGYAEAVVDSMEIAVTEPIMIKNLNQIWGDYLNGAIQRIWIGDATAEEVLPEAAEKVRKSGLLQGTY